MKNNINMNDNIVCLMTSYPKRINLAINAIKLLLEQTLKPTKIYLTLSLEEFPDKETNLPDELNKLVSNNEKVEIYWVKDNTKTIKKLFPIINELDDEDIIVNCDDDIAYEPDILESRYKDFLSYGKKYPITSQTMPARLDIRCNRYGWAPVGMFTKKMLKGNELLVDEDVINTFEDDTIVSCIFILNGYLTAQCSKYKFPELKQIDQENSSGLLGLYNGENTNKVLDEKVRKLYGLEFSDILQGNVIFHYLYNIKNNDNH